MSKQRNNQSRTVGTDSLQGNAEQLFMTPEVPAMTPKKSHKKRNIIIAIIALVILIPAAALAIYWFATPKEAPTKDNKVVVVDTAESIINKINVKLTNDSSKDPQPATITKLTPQSEPPLTSPSYKVSDADYHVTTTETYGLAITLPGTDDATTIDDEASQKITSQVIAVLTDTDYKKSVVNELMTNYESSSVVCSIASDSSPMYVACANKSAYTKISRDIKPFATAYESQNAIETKSQFTYSDLTVADSPDKKYQHASLNATEGFSGFVILLYRQADDKWQYFTSTQNILSCSDYKTIEVISAFRGEKCMDGETESTVGANTQPIATPAANDDTKTVE